jgi:hypothetical protein
MTLLNAAAGMRQRNRQTQRAKRHRDGLMERTRKAGRTSDQFFGLLGAAGPRADDGSEQRIVKIDSTVDSGRRKACLFLCSLRRRMGMPGSQRPCVR